MRLYLSSSRLGNKPEEMLPLIRGNKRTAIIINARDYTLPEDRSDRLQIEIENLVNLGLQPEELDLRKYFGKPNELRAAVQEFDYFWVLGGNSFLLRRAFKQSGFDELITELLHDDKVAYGGFSAGVCVLAPSLHGIELVDSKDGVPEGYDKNVVWEGLGVLGYAVAPHYKSDYPEGVAIDKCIEYFDQNHIPFKALRDGEAIVVNGDDSKIVA